MRRRMAISKIMMVDARRVIIRKGVRIIVLGGSGVVGSWCP